MAGKRYNRSIEISGVNKFVKPPGHILIYFVTEVIVWYIQPQFSANEKLLAPQRGCSGISRNPYLMIRLLHR